MVTQSYLDLFLFWAPLLFIAIVCVGAVVNLLAIRRARRPLRPLERDDVIAQMSFDEIERQKLMGNISALDADRVLSAKSSHSERAERDQPAA